MAEEKIEEIINKILAGEAQKNALDFSSYLRENGMLFERGKGYWDDKYYWMIRYKDEYVCFILVNGCDFVEDKTESECWTVWSDDSDSNWYADFPLDEHSKEIAWDNVDFCVNCGSCKGGSPKTILGREFNNVCRTTFRFNNPDDKTLEVMKKMMEVRKNTLA